MATEVFTVLAAEDGGEGESLQLLPDFAELVWGFIAFGLLFAAVWRFVVPRANQLLEDRSNAIQSRLEEAEQAKQEAQQARENYEQRLAEARAEADRIIEEARSDAERVRNERVSQAEEEARQIVSEAREEAEAERSRMVAGLRGEMAELSVELAERIVQKEIDRATHQELVDSYINELAGMN